MFDTTTVAAPDLDSFGTTELVGAIESTYRLESALTGRRLAVVATLLRRRGAAEQRDTERAYASVDAVEQTCAEVAAALNLSAMAASYQVYYAEALDTRLPRIAELLTAGRTDWRTVQAIISRTDLVNDTVIADLDKALADRIGAWRGWSRQRIINAVDTQVLAIDPDAAHQRRRHADDEREIGITAQPDGMAELWGTVTAADATVFDHKLSELAKTVCCHDPRTMAHRRADALYSLSTGTALRCRCERPECPARNTDTDTTRQGGAQVIVNVLAGADTLAGHSQHPGYLEGYGVIDAEQLRELAATAAHRILDNSALDAGALRYHPSAALERAIRCRDLTCRFPGCDRPAEHCDVDHTIPFNHADPANGGLTVPGNLKCLCRQHHRLKTFLGGPTGWCEEQLPDATVIWTSPTGKAYRTTPAGTELFENPLPARRACPRARERAARKARARNHNRTQRRINDAERALQQARKDEIDARRFRNHMRDMLLLFKGTASTSPFCTWINDPREPEELPPDWQPPPPPPPEPDAPPF